jgi:hypothetical protein
VEVDYFLLNIINEAISLLVEFNFHFVYLVCSCNNNNTGNEAGKSEQKSKGNFGKELVLGFSFESIFILAVLLNQKINGPNYVCRSNNYLQNHNGRESVMNIFAKTDHFDKVGNLVSALLTGLAVGGVGLNVQIVAIFFVGLALVLVFLRSLLV